MSQTPSSGTFYTNCIYNINIRSQTLRMFFLKETNTQEREKVKLQVKAHSIHIA